MSATPQSKPEFIVDEAGTRRAVILSFEEYQELLDDLDDLAVIAERRDETTVSQQDLERAINAGTV